MLEWGLNHHGAAIMELIPQALFLDEVIDSGLQLEVFAQPKYEIAKGQDPVCFETEILVRPRHNGANTEAFYDTVAGLSIEERLPIELQVLQTALRAANSFDPSARVAVNVTPFLLVTRPGQRALAEGVPDSLAPRLTLELVEYEPVDIKLVRPVLERLCARGVDVALDDYGKGFCCLPSLVHLPMIRNVKLSGVYASHARARKILPHVLAAAKEMGVDATMELVEHQAMLDECIALGIRYAQGHYLGKPLPIAIRSATDAKSCCEAA